MQNKIKILHIQETINSGGVERRRLSLAKHLNKELFDQRFICTFERGNIADEIRTEGFKVISIGRLNSLFDWRQHRKVQQIIEDYKPDIIHGAVFEGVTMAVTSGLLKKVPIIIIEETSDPLLRSWKANMLMKLFCAFSDKVVGVSPAVTSEYLRDKLNISSDKLILINNGVAFPREILYEEISKAKLQWGIDENDFVVGTTGRMINNSNKRFSDLIEGFAQFARHKSDVKLLMVGTGSELDNYRKLADSLKISEKVIFTGYQSDITLFYRMMNVFSLLSLYESFGLVLAEAMLNKLPIIATKVGGMKYIVDDEETGYLISSKNKIQVQEKLDLFYHDRPLCRSMGERGYEKAINNYTEKIYVSNVEQLYKSQILDRSK